MTKLYKGDIGTEIVLDCGTNIAGATSVSIKVKKPDASTVTWVSSVHNLNSVKYTTVAGDLNLPGKYLLQAHVTLPTWEGLGETVVLQVYDVFK